MKRTEIFEVGYRSPNYRYRRYARFKDRNQAMNYAREKTKDGRTHVKVKMKINTEETINLALTGY